LTLTLPHLLSRPHRYPRPYPHPALTLTITITITLTFSSRSLVGRRRLAHEAILRPPLTERPSIPIVRYQVAPPIPMPPLQFPLSPPRKRDPQVRRLWKKL